MPEREEGITVTEPNRNFLFQKQTKRASLRKRSARVEKRSYHRRETSFESCDHVIRRRRFRNCQWRILALPTAADGLTRLLTILIIRRAAPASGGSSVRGPSQPHRAVLCAVRLAVVVGVQPARHRHRPCAPQRCWLSPPPPEHVVTRQSEAERTAAVHVRDATWQQDNGHMLSQPLRLSSGRLLAPPPQCFPLCPCHPTASECSGGSVGTRSAPLPASAPPKTATSCWCPPAAALEHTETARALSPHAARGAACQCPPRLRRATAGCQLDVAAQEGHLKQLLLRHG